MPTDRRTAFYRRAGSSGGAVGLFHETLHQVQPGTAGESLYVEYMPDDLGWAAPLGWCRSAGR